MNDLPASRPALEEIESLKIFVPAISSFVGALIGAAAAIVSQWIAHNRERHRTREKELLDAYARWAATLKDTLDATVVSVNSMAAKLAFVVAPPAKPLSPAPDQDRLNTERWLASTQSVRMESFRIRLLDPDRARADRVRALATRLEVQNMDGFEKLEPMAMVMSMAKESERLKRIGQQTMAEVNNILDDVARTYVGSGPKR